MKAILKCLCVALAGAGLMGCKKGDAGNEMTAEQEPSLNEFGEYVVLKNKVEMADIKLKGLARGYGFSLRDIDLQEQAVRLERTAGGAMLEKESLDELKEKLRKEEAEWQESIATLRRVPELSRVADEWEILRQQIRVAAGQVSSAYRIHGFISPQARAAEEALKAVSHDLPAEPEFE